MENKKLEKGTPVTEFYRGTINRLAHVTQVTEKCAYVGSVKVELHTDDGGKLTSIGVDKYSAFSYRITIPEHRELYNYRRETQELARLVGKHGYDKLKAHTRKLILRDLKPLEG